MTALSAHKMRERVIVRLQNSSFDAPEAAWVTGDNALFKGTREQVIVFALANFTFEDALVSETFSIVPERVFKQDLADPDLTIVELLPAGATGLVTQEMVDLVKFVTGNYRNSWGEAAILTAEHDGGGVDFFKGTRASILGYMFDDTAAAGEVDDALYSRNQFAIEPYARAKHYGVTFTDVDQLLGSNGLARAYVSLISMILA